MSLEHSAGRWLLLFFIPALGHLSRHSVWSVFNPVMGISRVRLAGLWCLPVWSNTSLDVAVKVCIRRSKRAYALSRVLPFVPPGSSVHGDSPGKNTGVGGHALLQGIFPSRGSNPRLL